MMIIITTIYITCIISDNLHLESLNTIDYIIAKDTAIMLQFLLWQSVAIDGLKVNYWYPKQMAEDATQNYWYPPRTTLRLIKSTATPCLRSALTEYLS